MDNKILIARSRSKSIAVANQRSLHQYPSDTERSPTLKQEKDPKFVSTRQNINLENAFLLHNLEKPSVMVRDDSKHNMEKLALSPKKDRCSNHRFSIAVPDQPTQDQDEIASYKKIRHNSVFGNLQTLSSFSFHKKNVFDLEKTKTKILDPKKDSLSRMRNLKQLSDKCTFRELEDFYKKYYTFIYHTIHEYLKATENQQVKPVAVSSKYFEAKEYAVHVFEILLCCIPVTINKRWQYRSIANIIRHMLQADVPSKTYSDGLKLFVIWYSILMENAEEDEHVLFSSLLLCHDGSENHDIFIFSSLLKLIVNEIKNVHWDEQANSYNFMLRKLETCYFKRIFPYFRHCDYTSFQYELFSYNDEEHERSLPNHQQVAVDWLVSILGSNRKGRSISREKFGLEELMVKLETESQEESEHYNPPEAIGSPSSGDVVVQVVHEKGKNSRNDKYEFHFNADEKLMMQRIFYSCKSNVNMVLEVFCQAFTKRFCRSDLVKGICHIYKLWLTEQIIPDFLHKRTPPNQSVIVDGQGNKEDDFKIEKQKLIQIFISQSCTVFFYNWKNLDGLKNNSSYSMSDREQIYISNQVLNLYRKLIMDVSMETQTWNCLLEKLMEMCYHVILLTFPDMELMEDICKKLIESLLVAIVRASLTCSISKKLWDQMAATMAALMHNSMVVHQWGSTMVMLTKMLGQWLYNIDLINTSDDLKKLKKRVKQFKTKGAKTLLMDKLNVRPEENIKLGTKEVELSTDECPISSSNKDASVAKELRKSDASSESSNQSPEKIVETFCITNTEISTDINSCNDPLPSIISADDNTEVSKDTQSSLERSESSGSFENSSILHLPKDLDDSIIPFQTENFEKLCKSKTESGEIGRESSMDDKLVEMDLTELKEHPLEGDRLRFVWLKMLCITGNVASTSEKNNFLINQNLKAIHDCMLQIYKHQDFVNDGKFPILVLVPWVLQIIHMPRQLLDNKLIAYSMICDYMLHVPLSPDYLSRFYFTIHVGIQSSAKDVSRAIIRHYSKQIFGRQIGRGIILLEDFLHAAINIMCSEEQVTKTQIPDRIEAARLLASFVNIPNHYSDDLKVLDPLSPDVQLKTCDLNLLKNVVINILMNSINGNQKHSRVCSFSICGLGIFLLEEIFLNSNHPLIVPVVKCLLSIFSLDAFSNYNHIDKLLACQALSVLKDHHQFFHCGFQNILRYIFENLLIYVNGSLEAESLEKEFKIVSSIMLNLLEWFLVLPIYFLLEKIKDLSILDKFFKVTLVKAQVICEHAYYQNKRDVYLFQMKLFIDFVFCHLINYIGLHHDLQEISSSESLSLQLMTWLGKRIFEASQSVEDMQYPSKNPPGLYISPAYNLTIRDLTGKWLWFVHAMDAPQKGFDENQPSSLAPSDENNDLMKTSMPCFEDVDIHEDVLIKALNLISDTSPECFPCSEQQSLTIPFPCSLVDPIQDYVLSTISQQQQDMHNFKRNHHECHIPSERISMNLMDVFKNSHTLLKITRSFGISCIQERNYLDFLVIGDQLVREMKHFDAQKCLETHKVAIFYVGPNQYNKREILLNKRGSPSFDEFISQLGELIDLKHHKGFLGGLSTSGSTGDIAPYFSPSSLLQVIFHVSTLLSPSHVGSSDEDESVRKMRHLGNDEVHIIWMENNRSYTTDLIPTKFGEVTIVIYPLPRHLFRIQILKKIMMDTFGPLFDGAIVGRLTLPALVRSTAINAGRAIRETRDHYQRFYEERYSTLLKIDSNYKKKETYEQFLCSATIPGKSPSYGGVQDSNAVSFLSMDPRGLIEFASNQQSRPEKKIKMDIHQNKKIRSEFILPIKVKAEKRNQDAK